MLQARVQCKSIEVTRAWREDPHNPGFDIPCRTFQYRFEAAPSNEARATEAVSFTVSSPTEFLFDLDDELDLSLGKESHQQAA